MNILLLENRGSTAHYFLRWLEENGHNVLGKTRKGAFNINDARSIWEQRIEVPVHCMIIDLNVPPDGLSDEQIREAQGGCLAGWIWLRDEVLVSEPGIRSRIIIYSAYTELLNQNYKEECYGIMVVPKRKRNSSQIIKEHIHAIERILPLS